jgi:hypothetical protein
MIREESAAVSVDRTGTACMLPQLVLVEPGRCLLVALELVNPDASDAR